MRVTIFSTLILASCICAGFSQPEDDCFNNNRVGFQASNRACSDMLTVVTGSTVTENDLSAYCTSACSTAVNTYFEAACGFGVSELLCSKERGENGGFCLTTANIATVDVDVGRIAGSNSICDVATTNCSTSEECSQAAANLPCCANVVERYFIFIASGIPNALPIDCNVTVCEFPQFGGSGGSALSLAFLPLSALIAICLVALAIGL